FARRWGVLRSKSRSEPKRLGSRRGSATEKNAWCRGSRYQPGSFLRRGGTRARMRRGKEGCVRWPFGGGFFHGERLARRRLEGIDRVRGALVKWRWKDIREAWG